MIHKRVFSTTFRERLKEHLKAPSPIYDHFNTIGNTIILNNFTTVGRWDQIFIIIGESIYIRVNNPSLNKNTGKCHLPHMWDKVLLNTS